VKHLVDFFGKKKLEDRIAELESRLTVQEGEKNELLRTLDKREEKIRKLTSAYQEASLALKAAEQKLSLVPSKSASERPAEMELKAQGTKLVPREMKRMLMRLQACRSPTDDLLTAYLHNADSLPMEAERLSSSIKSERGYVVLQSPQLFSFLLIPPFPIHEDSSNLGGTFQLDSLQEMMETPVLVVSAHAGDTFIGVAFNKDGFEVQDLVESQVKEKHSKGGWSQKRFERLREEDIKNHVETVIQRLLDLKIKYSTVVKFAVITGDTNLLKQISTAIDLPKVERRLERHDEKQLSRLLDEIYGFTCYRF
jgi:uncharacterized coiled-coil protein SlyX